MSSTAQATSSSSNVNLIIDAALADYTKITGIDLSESPFAAMLEHSNSPEAILLLLQERQNALKTYRDSNRRLIGYIGPAVEILHAFSGIFGEAVSHERLSVTYLPVNLLTWPRQIPFSPAKAVFTSIDVLLTVRPLNTLFNQVPCNLRRCQAASGVSSSYDALFGLFERLGNLLKRLKIYVRIPPTTAMTVIIVKIMVQVLSVLALGTKQIKQGQISRCTVTYIACGSMCHRVVF